MQRLMVTFLTMVITIVMAEPHTELEEGDSPCLHKPCEHGVCVESAASVQVMKIIMRRFQYWSILTKASQRLPLRILDLEFFHQNPLRTSRDDHWDH